MKNMIPHRHMTITTNLMFTMSTLTPSNRHHRLSIQSLLKIKSMTVVTIIKTNIIQKSKHMNMETTTKNMKIIKVKKTMNTKAINIITINE